MGRRDKKRRGRLRVKMSPDAKGRRLHPEAQSALRIIQSHAAAEEEVGDPEPLSDGGFVTKFHMSVSLPSRANKRGISETGVKPREPVTLHFPSTYPFHAPIIILRPGFNRSLPHINPSLHLNKSEHVFPCVYDGNLDDLLHQEGDGLSEILNQLSDWLSKAAINDLIDPNQGWEPIRRDDTYGWVVYDLTGMRNLVQDKGDALAFQCRFWRDTFLNRESFFVYAIDYQNPHPITPWLVKSSFYIDKRREVTVYGSLVIFVWSDKVRNGVEYVVNHYLPEDIQNLGQLLKRAENYGFYDQLRSALIDFCWAYKEASVDRLEFPLFVILCARRPCALIGDNSTFELIPYMIHCHVDDAQSPIREIAIRISDNSQILPLGHRHVVSSRLLRRMSGGKEVMNKGHIVHIGCGSVGSKIAMHLARSGHGPFRLIDRGTFSPHNIARHALTGLPDIPGQPKASLLSQEIKLLRQEAEPIIGDIIEICKNPKEEIDPFPRDTCLIIESTGSMAVREMLSTLTYKSLPGTLLHTALYEHGRIGVMAIEGSSRNPNVSDLIIRFWDERIENPELASRFSVHTEGTTRQEVGLGCGSHTMVMPDSRLSVFAAGMAERARQILENGASETGELWIGSLEDNGVGVAWRRIIMGQTTVLKFRAQNRWEIRILRGALDQIEQELTTWSNTETGGVLIGRISLSRRCFTISKVLEAPPDSVRSQTSFVLGIQGLRKRVEEIGKTSGGTLSYVGTWHSHPRGGDASSIDKDSLEGIKKLRFGAPSLGLIWTPSGFKAIIDEGKLA